MRWFRVPVSEEKIKRYMEKYGLSKKDIDEIIREYKEGVSVREIASRHKITSLQAIYDILDYYGVERRKKIKRHIAWLREKEREKLIADILRSYKRGETIYGIAKKHNISTSTVYYILQKYRLLKKRK
jgi:transposase-like protein